MWSSKQQKNWLRMADANDQGEDGCAKSCCKAFCVPLGEGNYTHRACGKWVCGPGIGKHVPILTPTLAVAFVVCFFTSPGAWDSSSAEVQDHFTYVGPGGPWYTPLSCMFLHLDASHVGMNVALMLFGGASVEITEGTTRVLFVIWGGQTLGIGLHGGLDGRDVVGASASCYGLLYAQVALLLLNWTEMPARWFRAGMLLALVAAEALVISLTDTDRSAHLGHLFGATAGFASAIVLAINVKRRCWELCLNFGPGVLLYAGLVVAAFATGQTAAGSLAAVELPVLLAWAMNEVRLYRRDAAAEAAALDTKGDGVAQSV